MIPVEADLVIVDWSGIVHGAWHEAGPEGMLGRAAGELLDLLASPRDDEGFEVPRLVLATDAGLPTHRHELTAALYAPKRYKVNRTKKPREFWPLVDRLEQLPLALRIPTLAPEGFAPQTWEADDSAATACRLARAEGLSVLLASRDKDWRINADDKAPSVRWWSPVDKKLLDVAGVIGEHGVPPALLADWLALVGDSSDNVPGAEGIGGEKATRLLTAWGSLDAVLAQPPLALEALADEVKALEKARRARDAAKKKFLPTEELETAATALARSVDLWKLIAQVHAHRADVELSRKLVELRTDAPIAFDADEALVGGWEVREVRTVLERLGCGWLGNRVEARRKVAPSRGRRARREEGAPAPRRTERNEQAKPSSQGTVASGEVPAEPQAVGVGVRRGDAAPVLAGEEDQRLRGQPHRSPPRGGGDDLGRRDRVHGGDQASRGRVRPDAGGAGSLRPESAPTPPPGVGAVDWLNEGLEDGTEPAAEASAIDEQIARSRVAQVHTALGRKYLIEDLEGGRKYPTLRPEVRTELLATLRRGEVAA